MFLTMNNGDLMGLSLESHDISKEHGDFLKWECPKLDKNWCFISQKYVLLK